jgi:hypothetical protein
MSAGTRVKKSAPQQRRTDVVRKLIAGITFVTAIAPTILAAAETRHRMLPPEHYDHPYNGELEIVRHETLADIQAACPTIAAPLACAKVLSASKCEIHLPPDYMYPRYSVTADVIMRHEIGHCNGWKHDPETAITTNGAPKPPVSEVPPTNDDAAKAEERKERQIATTYKSCLLTRSTDAWKRTYTQEEINNYCGCFSVIINERVSEQEWRAASAAGTWSEHPVLKEVTQYCTKKYYNLPDVTAIRKKQW